MGSEPIRWGKNDGTMWVWTMTFVYRIKSSSSHWFLECLLLTYKKIRCTDKLIITQEQLYISFETTAKYTLRIISITAIYCSSEKPSNINNSISGGMGFNWLWDTRKWYLLFCLNRMIFRITKRERGLRNHNLLKVQQTVHFNPPTAPLLLEAK